MIAEGLFAVAQMSDSDVQKAIAAELSPLYSRIDLTIPAQREVANQVRSNLRLPSLRDELMDEPMGSNDEVIMNIEEGEK